MSIDPDLVAWIDHARSRGMTYDLVTERLQQAGHHDAEQKLRAYGQITDHLGRPRSQTNPGDPADPIARLD